MTPAADLHNEVTSDLLTANEFAEWFRRGQMLRRWQEAKSGVLTVWSIRTDEGPSTTRSAVPAINSEQSCVKAA